MRLAVTGIPAGRFKDGDGEQYEIMVRTPIDARPDVRALDQVRVATLSGDTLPLAQLARVEFSSAPTEIHRYNRERAVTIDADVKSGYNTDRVTKAVLDRLEQLERPRGYSYVPAASWRRAPRASAACSRRWSSRCPYLHAGDLQTDPAGSRSDSERVPPSPRRQSSPRIQSSPRKRGSTPAVPDRFPLPRE